jgi:diguanylate cyclase (GGDEF)-like protein
MQQPGFMNTEFNPDLNPYVGKMANRLVRSFTSDKDTDRWALVTEVLGFAAEAEQKLSEQQLRIKQLESLAATDELTGIANRRGFEEFMQHTLANSRRYGENGVFAFLDLNRFKAINDSFGHQAGNAALKQVAHLLKESVRESDFVARLGGDEFAIVLTHCDAVNGRMRMNKIAAGINRLVVNFDGRAIPISASWGLVCFDSHSTLTWLLETADRHMYHHKRGQSVS